MATSEQQRSDPGNGYVAPVRRLYTHPKQPECVVLLCMGPSITDYLTACLTQEFDPSVIDEVWSINMSANAFRSDLVIWMDDLQQQRNFRPKLMDALKRWNAPVLTSKAHLDIVPNSYDYPIEEIAARGISVLGKPYLNNGVAMAIAYGLHIGVKKMTIFGADFTYVDRNIAEMGRACTEVWIMIAHIGGMDVALSPGTSLMDNVADHGIYGYSEQPVIPTHDGRFFKYAKPGEVARLGKYVPEDVSGAKHGNGQGHGVNAGAGGTPGAPVAVGDAPGNQVPPAAAPAVAGPGEGVRDHGAGRSDQGAVGALHDSGGGERGLPLQAQEQVPPDARGAGPRSVPSAGDGAGAGADRGGAARA